MLVLARCKDESVEIDLGDQTVIVTVNRISKGRVFLGFEAPRTIPINRLEVAKRIRNGTSSNHTDQIS